jgi:hypothetical protein
MDVYLILCCDYRRYYCIQLSTHQSTETPLTLPIEDLRTCEFVALFLPHLDLSNRSFVKNYTATYGPFIGT